MFEQDLPADLFPERRPVGQLEPLGEAAGGDAGDAVLDGPHLVIEEIEDDACRCVGLVTKELPPEV